MKKQTITVLRFNRQEIAELFQIEEGRIVAIDITNGELIIKVEGEMEDTLKKKKGFFSKIVLDSW